MEIHWNKIYANDKVKIFHCILSEMQIVKVYQFKDNIWSFSGCYILNLKYNDLNEIADFHFYTINYFLCPEIKRMCIQPLTLLSKEHVNDSDFEIDQWIITWYKNCKQKYKLGIDILGQEHGVNITDKYAALQDGKSWDEIAMSCDYDKEYKRKKITRNFNNAYDAINIALCLYNESVINILLNSKTVSIHEIFA